MYQNSKTFSSKAFLLVLLSLPLFLLGFQACSSDDDDNSTGPNGNDDHDYVLLIENGAQVIQPDESLTYNAVVVDEGGNITSANNVTWTSSDNDVCTISANGSVTVANNGVATVTAETTVDGNTLTASVPLRITIPELFVVAPAALILVPGESIPLYPVFHTEGNVTYTYASNNTSVATASGNTVTAQAAGLAEITVTATNKNNASVIVPVLVVGIPQAELPVTRVTVNPQGVETFRGEEVQFSAKAYRSDGAEIAETITWESLDPNILSINSDGLATAHAIGETTVKATAKGIFATSNVTVYPDTMVYVTPIMGEVTPGGTVQFTARAFNVREQPPVHLTGVTQFDWFMPSFGDFGPEFEMFDIGTIDQNGLLTAKQDAMIGMTSVVLASVSGKPETTGGATVMVSIGFPMP